MTAVAVAVRYAGCAVAAGALNLAAQQAVFAAWPMPGAFTAALLAGTATGLVAKYALDKRFIFADPLRAPTEEIGRFGLYTATGIATTAIFWATEWAFHRAFDTDLARLGGGALGLTAGYVAKYFLDRSLVFAGAPE